MKQPDDILRIAHIRQTGSGERLVEAIDTMTGTMITCLCGDRDGDILSTAKTAR